MESQNKYIGDDKFEKFLEHYSCPAPLYLVKMRFAGAICSPNLQLRPTDVISSLWPENQTPRLETKNEADLFFKFFMGLWDEIFTLVKENKIRLSSTGKPPYERDELRDLCTRRFEEIEAGYLEGFWGGMSDLKLPAYLAQMVDSLSEISSVYSMLAKKLDKAENMTEIVKHLEKTDSMAEKAVSFIIESSVLPRIETLTRVVH